MVVCGSSGVRLSLQLGRVEVSSRSNLLGPAGSRAGLSAAACAPKRRELDSLFEEGERLLLCGIVDETIRKGATTKRRSALAVTATALQLHMVLPVPRNEDGIGPTNASSQRGVDTDVGGIPNVGGDVRTMGSSLGAT